MRRSFWAYLLLLPAALASCVTFAFPPRLAMEELSAMARPAAPSFQGVGAIKIESSGKTFSGTIYLALSEGMFRIELVDAAGRTVMAMAGSAEKIIRLDMATGRRDVFSGYIPLLGGISAPAELVRIMATGAPPKFQSIKSTGYKDGMKRASVTSPDMELYYNVGRLIRVEGGNGPMAYELSLGAMAQGPMAEYPASAQIRLQGSMLYIQWNEARQGVEFAPGFFQMDERIGDTEF